MPTLQDVADHAGVSISTVSRVINGYIHVSREVRERVLESVEELDYRPNKMARGLRQQNSKFVGVLVRQQNTPFSSQLAYAIESTLFRKQFPVILCSTEGIPERENNYVDLLIEHQVSGVIIRPTRFSEHSIENVHRLLENNISVVAVDVGLPDTKISQVLSQNQEGGYMGVQHLVELGHRHIGIIAPTTDQDRKLNFPGNLRIRGIHYAFSDYQGQVEPTFIYVNEETHIQDGYVAMTQIVQQHPQVTAVFAITDVIAVGAMHAASEMGVSIPNDISLLGYDGTSLSEHVIPRLTTIVQPIKEMGEMASYSLMDHMTDENAPIRSVILESRLQIRDSTAKPGV